MTDGQMPSNRVAIASGMVAVQANCTPDEAVVKMTDAARDTESTLDEVAQLVIDHEVRFS